MSLFISLVISSIGLAYFIYGKKLTDFHFLLSGIALMLYPYFISDVVLSLLTGLILLIAPFITRRLF